MVVEATPSPALIVSEAEFLLELAIVPLDAPAQLCRGDELAQERVGRERADSDSSRRGIPKRSRQAIPI